jgi:phosphate transport system protein
MDDRVDELQREIEEKVVATIARRQPMAVDLRELVGALRISNDLERVGDLAKNIAKRVALLMAKHRVNEVVLQLRHMADLARDRLTRVLQGYEHRDVVAAVDIWRKDQEIDALNTGLFRELITFMMEDPRSITFLHSYAFLREKYRAHGRPRHQHRRNHLLRAGGASDHRAASQSGCYQQGSSADDLMMGS